MQKCVTIPSPNSVAVPPDKSARQARVDSDMMTPLSTMSPPSTMDPPSAVNPLSAVGPPSAMAPLTSLTPGLTSQQREDVNCDHITYKDVQQSASQSSPSFQECKPHWTAHCCGLVRKNDPATDGTPGGGILKMQMIFIVLVKIMSNSSHVLSSTVFESKLAEPKTRNRLKDLLLPWCGG